MKRRSRLWIVLAVVTIVALGALAGLYWRAAARRNHVALTAAAKPVTVVQARAATYQPTREYVGVTAAWSSARVGPQYVSAYVESVIFRPGAKVKRGEVLAALDCRSPSASSREVLQRARAIEQQQRAVADEAARIAQLERGGFASPNELEQLRAKAQAHAAENESLRANLAAKQLAVDDCILRAPFDGEIIDRFMDPGAYVRPGEPVLAVADRSTIRVTADAPEDDFTVVAPAVDVDVVVSATGRALHARISRRTPATDEETRTVHFEIDIADPDRTIPVGATARITIPIGSPRPATEIPLQAATVAERQATVFVAENGIAHRKVLALLGSQTGELFFDPGVLSEHTQLVLEGRSLLNDGDKIDVKKSL